MTALGIFVGLLIGVLIFGLFLAYVFPERIIWIPEGNYQGSLQTGAWWTIPIEEGLL